MGYANRFLDTEPRRAAQRAGATATAFQGFATDPCRQIFRRVVTTFSPAYADSSVIDRLYMEPLRAGGPAPLGELRRYRVPVGGGEIEGTSIGSARIELPRVDGARDGRRYRFAYGSGSREPGDSWFDQLVKVDTEQGLAATWHEPGCYPGEPVFVPDPSRAESEEDAGVLLSVVLDAARGTCFLLVLDARSMVELARARAPHAITFGFHGDYFPCA